MGVRLLTAAEFADYKDISKKIDTSKIDRCIESAEKIDLYDFLGDFLFDVVANKDEAGYVDLLEGSTFTIDGESYIQEGIKSLVADLAYARYLYLSNVNDTPFGVVTKQSQDSTPLDRNVLKDLIKQVQIDADTKFSLINKYLEENVSTFTRYSKGDNPTINTFSQRFDII